MPDASFPCPYCGRIAGQVWVHGHAQCEACGTNVDECCRGEHAVEEAEEDAGRAAEGPTAPDVREP
jgi:hypothetical protein